MRRIIYTLTALTIASASTMADDKLMTSATSKEGQSNLDRTQTLHTYSAGSFAVKDNSDARKIVDEILAHFGLSAKNWVVSVTDDNGTTPYAIGRYWPDGKREIFFNKEFMKTISGAGKWPAYCVAAHEIGHHIGLHLETYKELIASRLKDFELRADYYCGFLLGRLHAQYNDSISAINYIGNAAGYPTREQRIRSIGQGWKDATGKGLPDDEKIASTVLDSAAQPLQTALAKFDTRINRDLDGYDLATTGGKPGIQGVSLPECANACLKEKTCKAFSFDRWNGWCFLKGNISTSRLDPHSIVGVRKPRSLPKVSGAPRSFVLKNGRRFRDVPALRSTVNDRDQCKSLCEKNKELCIAINYLKSKSEFNCELFSQTEGHYPDQSADIGYWQQEPKN